MSSKSHILLIQVPIKLHRWPVLVPSNAATSIQCPDRGQRHMLSYFRARTRSRKHTTFLFCKMVCQQKMPVLPLFSLIHAQLNFWDHLWPSLTRLTRSSVSSMQRSRTWDIQVAFFCTCKICSRLNITSSKCINPAQVLQIRHC